MNAETVTIIDQRPFSLQFISANDTLCFSTVFDKYEEVSHLDVWACVIGA